MGNKIKFNSTPSKFHDMYRPKDFYSSAQSCAKKYCKRHPDDDKTFVYLSAQEAAELYESRIARLGKVTFRNFVYWKIKNDLYIRYIKNRKEDEDLAVDAKKRESMIEDKLAGMSNKEIAEKYGISVSAVQNDFHNWRKAGLMPVRKQEDMAHELTSDPAPKAMMPSDPVINFISLSGALMEFSNTFFNSPEILSQVGDNLSGRASIEFKTKNGIHLKLSLWRVNNEDNN